MSIKAQTLSYDFFVACTIFLMFMVIIFSLYSYANSHINDIWKIDEITKLSSQISEVWMREGTPENWNISNVIVMGLTSDYRLNQTKINYLNEMGYQPVKEKIGVGVYDFYLRIYDSANKTMFSFGRYPSEPDYVSRNKRIGIFNSTIVFIDTLVWQ